MRCLGGYTKKEERGKGIEKNREYESKEKEKSKGGSITRGLKNWGEK